MTNPAIKAARDAINDILRRDGIASLSMDLAEAAIAAYEKAMWRPIEEAPHNRSVLLGWRDWRDGNWCMEVGAASWGERVGGYSNVSHHGYATHFRPLPKPEGI